MVGSHNSWPRKGWLGALVAVAFCAACPPGKSEGVVARIARVDVAGLQGSDWAKWKLDRDQVREIFVQHLQREGRFELMEGRPLAPIRGAAWQVSLALSSLSNEISAELSLHRSGEESWHQRLGRVALGNSQGRLDSNSVVRAMVKEAAHAVFLRLSALQKTNAELVSDLASKEAAASDAALDVLAERKDAAAVPVLLRHLSEEDPEVVRHAMGALVQMREPRAVSAFIELSRGQDASFVQEIVYAIGSLGGPEAEAYLDTVAEGHDEPAVRAAARDSLAQLRSIRSLESHRRPLDGR